MTETYTPPTISNFNDNPPDDDGTISSANMVEWAKHINEIGTPLKNYIDAVNSEVDDAFDRIDSRETISFDIYNPAGDGSTDDWSAFNAAATALTDTGKTLLLDPSKTYLLDTDNGSITVQGFVIQCPGSYMAMYESGVVAHTDYGGVIQITGTTNEAFKLRRGAQFKGVNFYYPDQITTDPPTAYPATLYYDDAAGQTTTNKNVQGVVVEGCTAFNPYIWIDMGPTGSGTSQGNSRIRNNQGCPLNTGVKVTDTTSNIWITDNFFSPEVWQDSVGEDVREYVAEYGTAIEYIDGDSLVCCRNNIFGYNRGISYSNGTGAGNCIFQVIQGNTIDGTRFPIYMAGASILQGALIDGNFLQAKNHLDATDNTCRGLYINEPTGGVKITVSNNYFGKCYGNHLQVTDATAPSDSRLLIEGNFFEICAGDETSGAYYNISINGDKYDVLINSNQFINEAASGTETRYGIKIYDVGNLVVSNNHFDACEKAVVVDQADRAIITGNASTSTQDSTTALTLTTINTDFRVADNLWDKFGSSTFSGSATVNLPQDITYFTDTGTTTITTFNWGWIGRIIVVKFTNASPGGVATGGNIAQTQAASQNDRITLIYDGSNWQVMSVSP